MDLDKLIQNYEDIIEISKQTTADLEKTLALLKSQKLNQEKELSSNVTESIAYEDPRVQEQRDLALQNGYSKEDADEVAASYHYYYEYTRQHDVKQKIRSDLSGRKHPRSRNVRNAAKLYAAC